MIPAKLWDQSDRQKQTKVKDKTYWKGRFWAQSETVKKPVRPNHESHTDTMPSAVAINPAKIPIMENGFVDRR